MRVLQAAKSCSNARQRATEGGSEAAEGDDETAAKQRWRQGGGRRERRQERWRRDERQGRRERAEATTMWVRERRAEAAWRTCVRHTYMRASIYTPHANIARVKHPCNVRRTFAIVRERSRTRGRKGSGVGINSGFWALMARAIQQRKTGPIGPRGKCSGQ
jgi:hypothetical protein